MKVLNNIKSEHIVSIDIETVRIAENFEDLSDGYKSAWEYKNKNNGEIPDELELAELWTKTASLYAEFSKICAISLSFMHGGKLFCKEFYGSNEKKMLELVSATLENILVKGSKEKITYRLLGHASHYFDYPFMAKRYVINGLDIPDICDHTAEKPWTVNNLDTNLLWKVGGTGAGSSLQALCNVLDVPISKVDLVGDQVGKVYFEKGYAKIGRYCSYDTVATFNVFRKFKKESIFQFEDVEYKSYSSDDETEVIVAEQLPLLEKLYKNNYLSDEIKVELERTLKKKKPTAKDKANLRNILVGVYVISEFMKSDDKDTVARKHNEIDEFLKTV